MPFINSSGGVLGCFWDVLGMCLGRFWNVFGTVLECVGTCLVCVWNLFGKLLGCVWDDFGMCWGCFWKDFEMCLECFGIFVRSIFEIKGIEKEIVMIPTEYLNTNGSIISASTLLGDDEDDVTLTSKESPATARA